jgi:hypothetical protein
MGAVTVSVFTGSSTKIIHGNPTIQFKNKNDKKKVFEPFKLEKKVFCYY